MYKIFEKSSNADGQRQRPVSGLFMARVYWEMGDELFELNSIILKGERILVPTSLPAEMVEKLHEGYIGHIEIQAKSKRHTILPSNYF